MVGRERLEAQLCTELQGGGVVLLSAPGGWGKTVALVRALAALPAGAAVAWVAVDDSDDLPRLLACLIAALDPFDLPWRVDPDAMASLVGHGGSQRHVADELLNTLAAADTPRGVLAFDDLHRLQDPAALEWLGWLAERLPPNWTLALATRVDPPLPLALLRARGQLAEYRQADLAFAPAEVHELRTQVGDASAPETGELLARTDGWPAGLRLYLSPERRSGAAPRRSDVQRYLFDYLAAEVFDTLEPELQRFLLRVSVLPELSASRCAAVAQEPRALQLLEDIERRGLFASVLDVGDEFTIRLHDLFRGFLEVRLGRDHPEEVPQLLARAAAGELDLRRRVPLLLRAGQVAQAEAVLLQAAPRMLASGGGSAMLGLLEQFPPAQRDTSPILDLVRGLAAWPRFEWGAMQRALARAGDGFDAAGNPVLAQQARSLETVALTALNRLDEAAQRLALVRAQPMSRDTEALSELMAYWHSGARGTPEGPAQHLTRMVELLQGQPAETWYRCMPHFLFIGRPGMQRAMQAYVQGAMAVAGEAHGPLRAGAQAVQAWLLLWRGRIDEAAALLHDIEDDDRWLGQPRNLRMTLLALQSALAAAKGDQAGFRAAAQAMLDDVDHDAERSATWRGLYLYQCVRLADGIDDAELGQRLWQELQDQPSTREWPLMAIARATATARRQLWAGDAEAAVSALQPSLERVASVDMISAAADLRLTLAAAHLACGRSVAAWRALRPALVLAFESGETTPLRLGGARLLGLLNHASWPAEAERELLALLHQPLPPRCEPAKGPVAADLSQGLTPREQQILARMATGDSNKLIARAFDLSPHTVKRHVANILDKLGLSSRGQAAAWYMTH